MSSTIKNTIFRVIIGLCLVLPASFTGAEAQVANHVRFNIPFDFTVGTKAFHAGNYEVQLRVSNNTHLLRLSTVDNKTSILIYTNSCYSGDESETNKLIFQRYGSQYFLHQIWRAGTTDQYALTPSRVEKELMKQSRNRKDHLALGAEQQSSKLVSINGHQ